MTEITFQESRQLKNISYVDLRSPAEYLLDHIPGAINIPIFNDEERAKTGTIYKNINPKEARFLGLELISPKLLPMMKELDQLARAKGRLVLYCWRGGLRSESIYHVARMMRIPCYRLIGGYKAYRKDINDYFQKELPYPLLVLHGLTGVGKTRIIQKILATNGWQSLDLEGLANHRGSVFGSVGLYEQPTQKRFESLLWENLQQFSPERPIITECESKKIGRLLLPDTFLKAMKNGRHILLYDSPAGRVKRIIEDYQPQERVDEILAAISCLKERLGWRKIEELSFWAKTGDFYPLVEYLLINYYDPLYSYPQEASADYDLSVESSDEEKAAEEICQYLSAL